MERVEIGKSLLFAKSEPVTKNSRILLTSIILIELPPLSSSMAICRLRWCWLVHLFTRFHRFSKLGLEYLPTNPKASLRYNVKYVELFDMSSSDGKAIQAKIKKIKPEQMPNLHGNKQDRQHKRYSKNDKFPLNPLR